MQERPLDGKIAIVTGAASPMGLGRSMTEALVRAGARVSMMDVNPDWLGQSANDLREIGGDDCVMTQVVDVTSSQEAEEAVARTIAEMGGLHILVNNAGIAPRNMLLGGDTRNNFWEVSAAEWDRVMSVNAGGPFYMARAVVPHFLAQGWGRIIGVTTSMNTMYNPGGTPYGPSKAAHEALIAMASRELEGSGVTVMSNTNLIPDDAAQRAGAGRDVQHQPDSRRCGAQPREHDPARRHACAGGLAGLRCIRRDQRPAIHRLLLGRVAAAGGAHRAGRGAGGVAAVGSAVGQAGAVGAGVLSDQIMPRYLLPFIKRQWGSPLRGGVPFRTGIKW